MKKYGDFIAGFIGKENIAKIKKSKLKIVVDPNGSMSNPKSCMRG